MATTDYTLFSSDDAGSLAGAGLAGQTKLLNISKGAPILKPRPDYRAGINVATDFMWTLSPPKSAVRDEVPIIYLKELRLKQSNIINALAYWSQAISTAASAETIGNNPYANLYPGEPTDFTYILPYLTAHSRTVGNVWGDSEIELSIPWLRDQGTVGKLFGVQGLEAGAKLLATGVGHEVPKVYSGGSLENIEIKFVLLNTVSQEEVQKNWEFCYLLSYQNLQNRRNAILVDPPVFYEIDIPGIKFGYSVISKLEITQLGQAKLLTLDLDAKQLISNRLDNEFHFSKVIPEAYGISITLSDLIPQSRNFMESMRSSDNRNRTNATEKKTIPHDNNVAPETPPTSTNTNLRSVLGAVAGVPLVP